MRSIILCCLLLAPLVAGRLEAGEIMQGGPPIRDEAPVVVSGSLPGPGMWKVSRDGHVMHILGLVSPLPKRMEWQSRDVEKVLAQAGEVVLGPNFVLDSDIGFFGKIALLPSLIGVRRNPGNALLRDVVPAESYGRWLVLKQHYLGRDRDVEKMRPIFAANELYEAAIEDAGLTGKRVVWPVIQDAIKEHGIKRTEPQVKVSIRNPKAALKEFRSEPLGDQDCFDKMLQNLQTDVGRMAERANAWAVGDIEALRALPLGDQYRSCQNALMRASVVRKNGMGNADAEVRQAWLTATEAAIANNAVSFSLLPMSELLKPDGYLAALEAKGYLVETP